MDELRMTIGELGNIRDFGLVGRSISRSVGSAWFSPPVRSVRLVGLGLVFEPELYIFLLQFGELLPVRILYVLGWLL